jgi:hypothetical protein
MQPRGALQVRRETPPPPRDPVSADALALARIEAAAVELLEALDVLVLGLNYSEMGRASGEKGRC